MKPFKILWIDDEAENINLLKEGTTKWTSECSGNNYTLEIIERRTYDGGVVETARDTSVHLIITDLNLLDGKNGAEFIKQIVANEIYKDVLLYSSDSKALLEKVSQLDGIFYFSFTDIFKLQDKINNVIWQCLIREQYVLARHGL